MISGCLKIIFGQPILVTKNQFPHIEGMEDTIKCPSFNKQTKSWVVPENGFKTIKTLPSLQINFTGQTQCMVAIC